MYEFILPNAWLIALLPFLAAALIFIFVHRWPGISAGLSIFAIMTSFVLSIPVALAVFAQEGGTVFEFSTRWLSMPGLNVDMGLLLDPLTAVMLIVVTSIARRLTFPLNLPAPGRRQPLYFIFRFRRDLCFC
jgi:NADH-quinone oxidoreductase subunit L